MAGTTIQIPSEAEAAAALGVTAAPARRSRCAETDAPRVLGAYTVVAGDTLSHIAAANGVAAEQLAWMNGLDPDAPLLAGTALKLPTSAPQAQAAPAPAPEPQVVPEAAPHPVAATLTAPQIGEVASGHGVHRRSPRRSRGRRAGSRTAWCRPRTPAE